MFLQMHPLAGFGEPGEVRVGEEDLNGLLVLLLDRLRLFAADEEDGTVILRVEAEKEARIVGH